ncbi:hypothetical protein [Parasphingorhabdus pacifica]
MSVPPEPESEQHPETLHNEFHGTGASVQAHQVSGGVHFHGPQRRFRRPGVWGAVAVAVVLVAAAGIWVRTSTPDRSPLSIQVRDGPGCAGSGRWVFPDNFELADLPPREGLNNASAYQLGASTASGFRAEFTVHGNSQDGAVVLQDLRVKVLSREPAPTRGTVVSTCPGAGDLMRRSFLIDLDRPQPQAVPRRGDKYEPGDDLDPTPEFPYRVSSTDPEVFEIVATTKECACRWHLELDWASPEGSGTEIIKVGDEPFRSSAVTGGLASYDHSLWGDD